MEGYLAGDGHFDAANDRWRLGFGNNPQLADSFRTLAARLGASLTLSPTLVKMGRTRTFDAYRGEWRWRSSSHWNARQRAEVVAIEARAESEVWDIGVEDDPHLFALASGVLTHNSKPNPMPESVTDRPTKAHEQVFLLSKSASYYFDQEAIREPFDKEGVFNNGNRNGLGMVTGAGGNRNDAGRADAVIDHSGRNKRTVWTIATEPYPDSHFAVFPQALVKPCILAGTSERGVCAECGAPWVRETEKGEPILNAWSAKGAGQYDDAIGGMRRTSIDEGSTLKHIVPRETTGWRPTCSHEAPTVPAPVLDPFLGSGTTALVARSLGRRAIGVDLNREYLELAKNRCAQMGLLI